MINYKKYIDFISDIILDNNEIEHTQDIINVGKELYNFDKNNSLHIFSEMLYEHLGKEYLNDIFYIENLWKENLLENI